MFDAKQVKPGRPGPIMRAPLGLLQRKCACGGSSGPGGECAECQKKRLSLQRKATSRGERSIAPPIVYEVLRSPGLPLDGETLSRMGARFGHDFSRVRVHSDARAGESAHAVGALAYTVCANVVFRPGQYAPVTPGGNELLAHELAHVVQQTGFGVFKASPEKELEVSPADHPLEQHADAAAESALRGTPRLASGSGGVGGVLLQRQMAVPTYRTVATFSPTSEVYMCSRPLEWFPATHTFFRIGGNGKGNSTRSLWPEDRDGDCWQGQPKFDHDADKQADAKCEGTSISLACLQREYSAYPIGLYCARGPNSNTFVGHIARNCGVENPDPHWWNPGFDGSPPQAGTYTPSPLTTLLLGCWMKPSCQVVREKAQTR